MGRVMMVGPIGAGKTTLIQKMSGEQIHYKKTQAIEFYGEAIDTPGEYIENRQYLNALTVTACDSNLVVFLQDATSNTQWYSPGQSAMFNIPVVGVVTKIDIASKKQIEIARNALCLAGVNTIFEISTFDGVGVDAFLDYVSKLNSTRFLCENI